MSNVLFIAVEGENGQILTPVTKDDWENGFKFYEYKFLYDVYYPRWYAEALSIVNENAVPEEYRLMVSLFLESM